MINLNNAQKIYFRRLEKGSRIKLYESFILDNKNFKVIIPLAHLHCLDLKTLAEDYKKMNMTLCKGIYEKEKFLLATNQS